MNEEESLIVQPNEKGHNNKGKPSLLFTVMCIFSLVLNAHVLSIGSAIRYGFLAVSFSERGIDGKTYGFVESCIAFGFLGGFLTRKFTDLILKLKMITPKWMIVISMFAFSICALTSGLISLVDNNTIFNFISTLSRLAFGYFSFNTCYCMLDIAKYNFGGEFDFVNGLIQMGYYSGQGIAEAVGAVLYERYGYITPFIFVMICSVITMIWGIICLPNCDSILVEEQDAIADEIHDNEVAAKPSNSKVRVTWMIVFPVISAMLINNVYAFLQVSVTPYLFYKFDVPLSIGGTVVACISAGVAIGSCLSGFLSQKQLVETYTQMSIGAFMVGAGLLLMYPHPSLTFIYNNGPYLAYPAVIICGLGDPIISIASLRAMIDLQVLTTGQVTPSQMLTITGVWLVVTSFAMYCGPLVAGAIMEYMEFYQGAYLLSVICCGSLVINIVMYYVLQRLRATKEERQYLLMEREKDPLKLG